MSNTHEEISRLLSSALLVDVDLSHWDELIRFVFAVDASEEFGPDSDLYNFDCLSVSSLAWHAESAMKVDRHRGVHTRIQLWRMLISERDRDTQVELRTSGPTIVVECADVRLLTSDAKHASIVDPDWFKPGRPFARGSLEDVAARLTHARSRTKRA